MDWMIANVMLYWINGVERTELALHLFAGPKIPCCDPGCAGWSALCFHIVPQRFSVARSKTLA
jgi:hypothetical protein